MIRRKRLAVAAVAALASLGLVSTTPSSAESPKEPTPQRGVVVVAEGLRGPLQISATSKYFYVASDGGQVYRVRRTGGTVKTVIKGVSVRGAVRVSGKIYIASGETDLDLSEPGEENLIVPGLLVARTGHKPHQFADLLKYELTYNPDNQTQFLGDGTPVEPVVAPSYVIKSESKRAYLLVANAGGHDIIAVSKSGKMSTFFVPPTVTTGPCAEVEQNSDAGPSCDASPNGMAYGPDGNLYISTSTRRVEGEGRVYVVDKNGKLVKTLKGFSDPVGVAVGPDNSVYVSEAWRSQVMLGQIVKVGPDGKRSYVRVTSPTGLLYTGGKLYASVAQAEWDMGQLVSVDASAFVAK